MKKFNVVRRLGRMKESQDKRRKAKSALALLYFPSHEVGMRFRLRSHKLAEGWNVSFPRLEEDQDLDHATIDCQTTYENQNDSSCHDLDFRYFAAVGEFVYLKKIFTLLVI